jgi:hypothetical protein
VQEIRGRSARLSSGKAVYPLDEVSLREDVKLFAAEQKANEYKHTTTSSDQSVDGDHGRIETRTVTVFRDVAWLQNRPRLAAVEQQRHG